MALLERNAVEHDRLFQRMPAGRVQLLVEEEEVGRDTVLECDARAGKVTEVRWPE